MICLACSSIGCGGNGKGLGLVVRRVMAGDCDDKQKS